MKINETRFSGLGFVFFMGLAVWGYENFSFNDLETSYTAALCVSALYFAGMLVGMFGKQNDINKIS